MAGSLNKVLLIGRLGADPEIKQMVNGKSVARLSLATSNTWKDKNTGEKKEKTEWHRIVIFNEGLVNVIQQYVKKGALVYIEGQLTTRKWRDEKSGTDKYSTEVVLQGFNSSFKILSSKNNQTEPLQDNNIEKSSLPNDENPPSNDLDDEIPF
ncbi:MAG: single-strand DNA-binding protein [Pelagibacterales bacterium]|nr:single-strand DNA-binding protein [Pelagibacterales bacterium]